jgi:hypothetical protein
MLQPRAQIGGMAGECRMVDVMCAMQNAGFEPVHAAEARCFLDRSREVDEGSLVHPGSGIGFRLAAGARHPQAVLALQGGGAVAIGPAVAEYLVEPVLEQARRAVPIDRVHPHHQAGACQRSLFGGNVDGEIRIAVVQRTDLKAREVAQ